MRCIVINLLAASDRMKFMARQLGDLGLSYKRIDAVRPDQIESIAGNFEWDTWERPLKLTERGCFLSHVLAWREVIETDLPHLVLEDDAILSARTAEVLAAVESRVGIDHLTLEARGRRKILMRRKEALCDKYVLRRLVQDRSGAAAYILWPSGAKKLLSRADREVALADAMICKARELISYQVEPVCAVQSDRAAHYGIKCELVTQSQIDAGEAAKEARNLLHRFRRIRSQLEMGMRALLYSTSSDRREPAVDSNDFDSNKM